MYDVSVLMISVYCWQLDSGTGQAIRNRLSAHVAEALPIMYARDGCTKSLGSKLLVRLESGRA